MPTKKLPPRREMKFKFPQIEKSTMVEKMADADYSAQENYLRHSEVSDLYKGALVRERKESFDFGIMAHQRAQFLVENPSAELQDLPVETRLTGQNRQKFDKAIASLYRYMAYEFLHARQDLKAEVAVFTDWEDLQYTDHPLIAYWREYFPQKRGLKCKYDAIHELYGMFYDWKFWTKTTLHGIRTEWWQFNTAMQRFHYFQCAPEQISVAKFVICPKTLQEEVPCVEVIGDWEQTLEGVKRFEDWEFPEYPTILEL